MAGDTKTVLVVDDDAEMRETLLSCLSSSYSCLSATSGDSAFRLLGDAAAQGNPVDLVVADWKMPEGSGLDLLRSLRSGNLRNLPFVLMSGQVPQPELISTLELGVDAVIMKPFSYDQIIQAIRSALSSRARE